MKEPVNKRIEQQKRFFSTTKRKTTKKQRLQKPSAEERTNITNELLNEYFISKNFEHDHDYIKKK